MAGNHNGLGPQFIDGIRQFVNGFLRRVHRNGGNGRDAVRIIPKNLGVTRIESPAGGPPHLLILEVEKENPRLSRYAVWLDTYGS